MSFFATVSSTSARRSRQAGGQALMAVLGVLVMLGIMVSLALSLSTSTKSGTEREGRTQAAIQAADSAINRYVSRLVEDPYYYMHVVDAAEDTRMAAGQPYPAGSNYAQTGVFDWTYAGPPANWAFIGDSPYGAVLYSLRVKPSNDGLHTMITATGRVTGLPPVNGGIGPQPVGSGAVTRTVEATISPESTAGYQLISNTWANYGSVTNGKIYVNGWFNQGVNAPSPPGYASNSVYARDFICSNQGGGCASSTISSQWYNTGNSTPVRTPAPEYLASDTTPSFSTRFPTPIDFTRFTSNITSIRDYAIGSGTAFLGSPAGTVYMLRFSADGRYQVWTVNGSFNNAVNTTPAGVTYTLVRAATALPVPAVLYFDKPVIVGDSSRASVGDSVVNGRVTVATSGDITIGGQVSPVDQADDVIGLIAAGNVTFSNTLPNSAFVQASIMAQTGNIQSASTPTGHCNAGAGAPTNGDTDLRKSLLTYVGASITEHICGISNAWTVRNWSWDEGRKNFVPPLFPTLDGTYQIQSWREVTTPS